MLYERKKILRHRIIWLIITIIIILIPICIMKTTDDLEIIDDDCSIVDYYSAINVTACKIDITFNMAVLSGDVTIEFFDSNNNHLETKTTEFTSHGHYVEDSYISVAGKVNSYNIISYNIKPENYIFFVYYLLPFALDLFISSLLIGFKKYLIQGNEVIVYAGFYHHYIKINGEKYDEYNTLVIHTQTCLSCHFHENVIEATISRTNRISIKLNGKLINSDEIIDFSKDSF